jgi:hypothetical protein
MRMSMSRWVVPAFGFVLGLLMAAAALGRGATPVEAFILFAIVAGYAVGMRLFQARSETASLLSGLPVDERWTAINQRALSLAAVVMASILVGAFLVTQFAGGDAMPYAWLAAAFAIAYLGGILWYRWRQ